MEVSAQKSERVNRKKDAFEQAKPMVYKLAVERGVNQQKKIEEIIPTRDGLLVGLNIEITKNKRK